MRIVHLSTTLVGGAGIAARRMNAALKENGIDSNILSISNYSLDTQPNEVILPRSNLSKLKSKTTTFLQFKFLQSSAGLVTPHSISSVNLAEELYTNADIVHIHATYNLLNEDLLRKILNSSKKIFITLHDFRFFTGGCHYPLDCDLFKKSCNRCPQVKSPFQFSVRNAFERRIESFNLANTIVFISPSSWLAKEAESSKILCNKLVQVIRNPIPHVFAEQGNETNRNKLGFTSEEIIVAFSAGDLSNPNKGIKTLIKAMKAVMHNTSRTYKLLLIGRNLNEADVQGLQFLQRETSSDKQMAELLSAADVLVVPSISDNSPNVIGEALMSGLKVIGAKTGGITELMNEMNFSTFEINDYIELAGLLLDLDINYDRESIKKIAKLSVGYSVVANQMHELYSLKI